MKDKLKKVYDLGMTLFKKYEEIIVYLIVGINDISMIAKPLI